MGDQIPGAVRAATIGLLGTLLTACSGLTGAVISSAVTVYQVERQMQQVEISSPQSESALNIDAGGIFISRSDAANLDLEHGLAIRRPLPG